MNIWDGLLNGSVFNYEMMAEVWECLSPESKVALLQEYDKRMRSPPPELVRKALAEPFAYIRFLAGQHGAYLPGNEDEPLPEMKDGDPPSAWLAAWKRRFPGRDPQIDEAIANDPSPLVRASLAVKHTTFDGLKWMITAPRLHRLAHIAQHGTISGDFLVDFVHEAKGKLLDKEIAEVLFEYCMAPATQEAFSCEATGDAMSDFTVKGWFDKVWGLVGTVPKTIYNPIIHFMPTEAMFWEIPDEVVNRMSDEDLASVLRRSEAKLPSLRKRVAENPEKFGPEAIKAAGGWEPWEKSTDSLTQIGERLAAVEAAVTALVNKRGLFW